MRTEAPAPALNIIWQVTKHQVLRVQQRIPMRMLSLAHKLLETNIVEQACTIRCFPRILRQLNHMCTKLRLCCLFRHASKLYHLVSFFYFLLFGYWSSRTQSFHLSSVHRLARHHPSSNTSWMIGTVSAYLPASAS